MRNDSHHWISISDLMAGMLAVVVLLLVLTVIQKRVEYILYKEQIDKMQSAKKRPLIKSMSGIKNVITSQKLNRIMTLNIAKGELTLHGGVFSQGSACLTTSVRLTINRLAPIVTKFLQRNIEYRIIVQGYTNKVPVNGVVTDFQKYCAVYDDNMTLSAARANVVRHALINSSDSNLSQRIVVAAYGDTKPIPGTNPSSAINRRVSILFSR